MCKVINNILFLIRYSFNGKMSYKHNIPYNNKNVKNYLPTKCPKCQPYQLSITYYLTFENYKIIFPNVHSKISP